MPGHHRGCSRCWRTRGPQSSCPGGGDKHKSLGRDKGDKRASGWGQRLLYRVSWGGLLDIIFDTWNSRRSRSQCSRQFKIQQWAWHTQGTERLPDPEFKEQAEKGDEVVEAGGAGLATGPASPSQVWLHSACNGKPVKTSQLHAMFWRFVFKDSWWLPYGEWKRSRGTHARGL